MKQEECNHESFYRYWYNSDILINVCRKCFHGWEEKFRPYFYDDYVGLTRGKYKQTEEDIINNKSNK